MTRSVLSASGTHFRSDSVAELVLVGSIGLYLVLTPTLDLMSSVSWHDQQRLAQLTLLVLVASLWFCSRATRISYGICTSTTVASALIPAVLAILVFGVVSAAFAASPRWAFLEVAMFALLAFFASFVGGMRMRDPTWSDRALLLTVLVAVGFYSIATMSRYAAVLSGDARWLMSEDLFNGFSNPRFFGHFLTMTLPLMVVPLHTRNISFPARLAVAFLFSLWWAFAFASGTRGTWLAMMVAAVTALMLGEGGRRWVRTQVVFSSLGLLAYWILFYALPSWLGLADRSLLVNRLHAITSLSQRDTIWREAFQLSLSNPFLGIGPMHFAMYPDGLAAHPHNAVLQLLCEWGFPATVILLIAVSYFFVHLRLQLLTHGNAKDELPLLRHAVFLSLVGAGTQAMVDGVIVMPFSQTLLAVIAGWALGMTNERMLERGNRRLTLATAVIVTMSVLLVAHGVASEITRLSAREDAYRQTHRNYVFPRFWQDGLIDH